MKHRMHRGEKHVLGFLVFLFCLSVFVYAVVQGLK